MARRKQYLPMFEEKYKVYHDTFDLLKENSNIINADTKFWNMRSVVDWSKYSVQSMLDRAKGNTDGIFYKNEKACTSKLAGIKQQIDGLAIRFKIYQQRAVREGKRFPEEMPKDLFEELLKLHAAEDVALEEIAYLEDLLKRYIEDETKVHESLILKYGPIGTGKLTDNTLADIDGQSCSMVNGVLLINDARSPYRGMSVPDYKEFVMAPWVKAVNRKKYEHAVLAKEYAAQFKSHKLQEAAQELNAKLMKENPDWADLFGLSFKGKLIPKWPYDVKNYLPKETE